VGDRLGRHPRGAGLQGSDVPRRRGGRRGLGWGRPRGRGLPSGPFVGL